MCLRVLFVVHCVTLYSLRFVFLCACVRVRGFVLCVCDCCCFCVLCACTRFESDLLCEVVSLVCVILFL